MLLLNTLQQLDIINPANFFLFLATAGLALFFLSAALAAPLLAVTTENIYVLRQKPFYDKCALQITQTALGVGLFIFLILGAGLVYNVGIRSPEAMIFLLSSLKALVFLCAYLFTWSALKQRRLLHLVLGWSAALAAIGLLFVWLLLLITDTHPLFCMGCRIDFLQNPLPVLLALLAEFFSSPIMPLIYLGLLSTGLAAAASFSQLWLIVRRSKADYGRDYYTFAMRYCARAALFATLFSLMIGVSFTFLVWPLLTQPQDFGVAALAFVLPLACCLLWLGIAKSENPLRHKPGAFFACVLLFLALCIQLLMLLSVSLFV